VGLGFVQDRRRLPRICLNTGTEAEYMEKVVMAGSSVEWSRDDSLPVGGFFTLGP
jgi:hypothetical protein